MIPILIQTVMNHHYSKKSTCLPTEPLSLLICFFSGSDDELEYVDFDFSDRRKEYTDPVADLPHNSGSIVDSNHNESTATQEEYVSPN
jgi:hypothetical protein